MGYIEELQTALVEQNETEEDIDAACKYAENLISLDMPVIFNREHFSLLVGREKEEIYKMVSLLESHYYQQVTIKKKSGGDRILSVPALTLKEIQKWILDNVLSKMYVSPYAMGFQKDKSIVTNAKVHVGKKCVVNLDLKDFFPSVKLEKVFRAFYYYGYTISVSYLMARLCTYYNELPQGAPTSPYLSNVVCLKLDKRISELAIKYGASYTRYADDITLSANTDISNIIPVVEKIVTDEGFSLNNKKTRVLYEYQRQEVTGLLVSGNKVRVNKKYIKKFKQEIYYCKKYGVADHLRHIKCDKRFYKEHMYGKAYFVKMVDAHLGQWIIKELDSIAWE